MKKYIYSGVVITLFGIALFPLASQAGVEHSSFTYPVYTGSLPAIDNSIPTNQNVLCVYNSNSQISTDVCAHYLSKRPGAASLGLNIPDSAYETTYVAGSREDMAYQDLYTYVTAPIAAYVSAHPDLTITHLAMAKDLPIRVEASRDHANQGTVYASAMFLEMKPVSTATMDDMANAWSDNSCIKPYQHFDPLKCAVGSVGSKHLYVVSFLTGQTLADIEMMIDKAQAPAPHLATDKWVIDLSTQLLGSISNDPSYSSTLSKAYQPEIPWLANQFKMFGIDPSNVVSRADVSTPYIVPGEMVGFAGMGVWHASGYGQSWIASDPKVLGAVSNRALIDVYESYFGYTSLTDDKITSGQSIIAQAMKPTTFGGTNYSRSFSGAVGTVAEPQYSGLTYFSHLFAEYASGMSFAESANYNHGPMGIAVGDPLMKLEDTPLPRPTMTFPPIQNLTATVNANCYYPKIPGGGLALKQPDGSYLGKTTATITLNWTYPTSYTVDPIYVFLSTPVAAPVYLFTSQNSMTFGESALPGNGLAPGTYTYTLAMDYNSVQSVPTTIQVTVPEKGCHVTVGAGASSSSGSGSGNTGGVPVPPIGSGTGTSNDNGTFLSRTPGPTDSQNDGTTNLGGIPTPAVHVATSLGVVVSDTTMPQSVQRQPNQILGAFDVTACGESSTVQKMSFAIPIDSIAYTDPGVLKNVSFTDSSGTVLAGPLDIQPSTWLSGQTGYDGWVGYYRFDFTTPVTFAQGTHTYYVRADVPPGFIDGLHVVVSTWPQYGWSGIRGVQTGSTVNMSANPGSELRTPKLTVTSSGGEISSNVALHTGPNSSSSFIARDCHAYSTNLVVGSTGQDVAELQRLLMSNGFAIPSLPTLPAPDAGQYFGLQTSSAVSKFQVRMGLPATGAVGPLTRGKLNAISVGALDVVAPGSSPNITTPPTTPTVSPMPYTTPTPAYSPPVNKSVPSQNASPSATPVSTPSPTPIPTVTTNATIAAPTATFTIEGAHGYTYNVGQYTHYAWSSTNADTFSSSYTSSGPSVCGGGVWMANTPIGSDSEYIANNYAGCVWTVTYTVRDSKTGQSASDTVKVTVKNPLSSPNPSPTGTGAMITPANLPANIWIAFLRLFNPSLGK